MIYHLSISETRTETIVTRPDLSNHEESEDDELDTDFRSDSSISLDDSDDSDLVNDSDDSDDNQRELFAEMYAE